MGSGSISVLTCFHVTLQLLLEMGTHIHPNLIDAHLFSDPPPIISHSVEYLGRPTSVNAFSFWLLFQFLPPGSRNCSSERVRLEYLFSEFPHCGVPLDRYILTEIPCIFCQPAIPTQLSLLCSTFSLFSPEREQILALLTVEINS